MRRLILFFLVMACCAGVGFGAYWSWQVLLRPTVAEVLPLAEGDQEIAWFYPATSGDTWERQVAALKILARDWQELHPELPGLQISFEDAFLEQTAAVPQIALSLADGSPGRLWLRWYKESGDIDQRQWLEKMIKRGRPPLAIIGGDTSGRALDLGRALQEFRSRWQGSPPLFLITTATADRYYPGDNQSAPLTQENWPKLVEVYKDRTYRFCFTNARMAEAVLDFVQDFPQIWPEYRCDPSLLAGAASQGQPLSTLGFFAAAGHLRPFFLYTLAWEDDRYSLDLADRFWKVFGEGFYQGQEVVAGNHYLNNYVYYSVGDFYQANPSEEQAVGIYLANSWRFRDQHQLMALPTGSQRARRFLRSLCRRAPREIHNLVVVSGDAVTFDNIYRDRDLAWNILDLPVPLIFFSHRNPVDEAAGFKEENSSANSGTQDVLLLRDIMEALVLAAGPSETWLGDAPAFQERLSRTRWFQGKIQHPDLNGKAKGGILLFDGEGNRRAQTGEHVIWLQPVRDEQERILPQASLSVWAGSPHGKETIWKPVGEPLMVRYNLAAEEEGRAHAGN